jgi:methyl-accepting chemotaxis protein
VCKGGISDPDQRLHEFLVDCAQSGPRFGRNRTKGIQLVSPQSGISSWFSLGAFNRSLGLRLITFFVLAAILPVAVVGVLSYQRASDALIDGALGGAEREVVLTERELLTAMEQFQSDLLAFRDTPPVQGIIRANDNGGIDPKSNDASGVWVNRLSQIFKAAASNKTAYQQLRYLDENGNEMVRIDQVGGEVTIVSGTGGLQNKSTSSYFTGTRELDSNQIYISELNLNKENGAVQVPHTPVIRFSTPVFDPNGAYRGALVANVYAESLLSRLRFESGEVYMVREDMSFVLHPDADQLFGVDLGTGANLEDEFAESHDGLKASGTGTAALVDGSRGEVVALRAINFDSLNPDRHWVLLRTLPTSEVLGAVATLRTLMIVLATIAVLLAGALGVWLSRSITGAVSKVGTAMNRISSGDVTVNVDESRQDELGDMARAYGKMRAYLQEAAEVATTISHGDVTTQFHAKGSSDTLGNALVGMVANLKDRSAIAEYIANGDLTVDIQPLSDRDLLGTALATMAANLRVSIGQVATTSTDLSISSTRLAGSAQQVGQATEAIAQNSQQVAQGAEEQSQGVAMATGSAQEQATAVVQATNAVAQVSKAATDVAQSAQHAADSAREATDAANVGFEAVDQTTIGMARIRDAVQATAVRIEDLGTKSTEIGNIIKVIDEIASQTNLLALNAAIEAARAGEQGRGFAVVADEVRKLAERVSGATAEITNLIESVQESVGQSIESTEEGTREVASGADKAEQAGNALVKILESVGQVAEQSEQISSAAEEVSASADTMVGIVDTVGTSADQARSAIDGVAGITRQNATATQELSAAAEEVTAQVEEVSVASDTLQIMAEELGKVVSQFKIEDISGRSSFKLAS